MPAWARSANAWKVAAPVVLALCGVLLVTSAKESGGNDLRGSDILELSDVVRAEERRTRELSHEVEQLTDEVEQLTTSRGSTETKQLQQQVDDLLPAAGLTPVEGPGLTVSLDDAPLPGGDGQELPAGTHIEDYIVHQQDLEGVINALWAGGAEALTVMDQRVVATSSIRCVGPVLRIDGRTYSPPYVISAIGDADAMRKALDESESVREFRQYSEFIGLGYRVEGKESIEMPGYQGSITGSGS
ncbi:MAG TPA: DUF881 domain-containing protein [Jiangellaceae bacterium]